MATNGSHSPELMELGDKQQTIGDMIEEVNHMLKPQKNNTSLAPIIIKKSDSINFTSKYISEQFLRNNINKNSIKYTKLDKNGNIVIGCADLETINNIINNDNLFTNFKKVDLNYINNNAYIIIKNMSLETAKEFDQDLRDQGIVDYKELKSVNRFLIKAKCINASTRDNLLANNLKIGFNQLFYTERCIKLPLQCRKCKKFGHNEQNCKNDEVCGTCGYSGHTSVNCSNEEKKCQNCWGQHSSFWRGCPEFKKLKDQIENKHDYENKQPNKNFDEKQNSPTKTSNGLSSNLFYKKYSEAVKGNGEQFDSVNRKLEKISNGLSCFETDLGEIKQSISEIQSDVSSINKKITKNNTHIFSAMLSIMKTLAANKWEFNDHTYEATHLILERELDINIEEVGGSTLFKPSKTLKQKILQKSKESGERAKRKSENLSDDNPVSKKNITSNNVQ